MMYIPSTVSKLRIFQRSKMSVSEAVIGAGIAVFGVVVSTLLTFWTDKQKRSWDVRQKRQEKMIMVYETRFTQVEELVQAIIEDFRAMLTDINSALYSNDSDEILSRMDERIVWRDNREVFAYTKSPIIYSLIDPDIEAHWRAMEVQRGMLGDLYVEIVKRKHELAQDIDIEEYQSMAMNMWVNFEKSCAQLYNRLDQLHASMISKIS